MKQDLDWEKLYKKSFPDEVQSTREVRKNKMKNGIDFSETV